MGFWDNTYGFLSDVGTARAHVGVWVAYVVGVLLVLAVPIALLFRAFGSKSAPARPSPPGPAAPGRELWRQFQAAKPGAVLASFACCVLVALIIVVISVWSLQVTKKYKPFAAFGGADLLLDVFHR